ncbi:MAG: hypothetical protein GXO68_03705 [Crenarchaeota archaeon]|nr:hypothetical protein [Thermoproteota archaeon]
MGVLGKLREKLSRRRPHEDLRDYDEIERMRREQERLRKLREEIMQKEREKVLKEKWRQEAKKKAEREAYGILTPSRKAAISRVLKKAQQPKRKKGQRSSTPLFGAGLFQPPPMFQAPKGKRRRRRNDDDWWWF